MTERTLTERELNRALLARQMLLERADLPITRAVERMGYVQSQYAPSSYIGLWTRLAGFERAQLTRALERRTVVQGTLMRGTIHIVPARDYWLVTAGIREDSRAWWLRTRRHVSEREIVSVAGRLRELLADGPRRRKELMAELGVDSTTWNGVGGWVDLLRIPPSGTWERRSADLYGLAETWLKGSPAVLQDEGVELLVRRYLGSFAPASRKDIASWAGITINTLAPVLERMRLRRFRDEDGDELLDLPRAPLPGAAGDRRGDARGVRGRAGPRPVPPRVGCHAARARASDTDPPRGLPPEALQHEDPAFVPVLPGRRGRSPARGSTTAVASWCRRSSRCREPRDGRSTTRRSASRPGLPDRQKSRRPSKCPAASGRVS